MDEPQFASEYAKSNRAGCKLCKNNIGMGSLRLAIFVQSPFYDGKVANWYHFTCFFKKKIPIDTSEIKGFQSLRWDDQQKIKAKMGLITSVKDENTADNEDKENKKDIMMIESFMVEYAKSARSKCQQCSVRIMKNEVRVQVYSEGWYHLECFCKHKSNLGFKFRPNDIPGYDDLENDDQKNVDKLIGEVEIQMPRTSGKRKIKIEPEEAGAIKQEPEIKKTRAEDDEKEHLLKTQSEEYWKLRDALDNEIYRDQTIRAILLQNDQLVKVHGRDNLLNQLCDMMYYGPLEKCPECKTGQLISNDKSYKCTGQFSEWTKCVYETQTPKRLNELHLIRNLKDEIPLLETFEFKQRQKIFEKSLNVAETKVKNEPSVMNKQPLYKMNFSATPKLSRGNPEIKLIIERLGGKYTTSLESHTVALISNEDYLDSLGKKILQSKELDIPVISEKILDDLCNIPRDQINVLNSMLTHKIGEWGSDLKTRIDMCAQVNEGLAKSSSETKFKLKSGSEGVVRMKIKGGAVVDPDSGLEDDAHILCDVKTKEPLSCVLGLVDIMRGANSYYKLQLIEHDKYKSKWYVFRSWGRVGTTIGGTKLTDYNKKHEAIEEFMEQYLDKTGNKWENRKVSGKKPNRFYPLDMDYGDEEEDETKSDQQLDANFVPSELDKPIQDIVKLIFDIETMKNQMKEFEIDLTKMPLGKISSNQIKLAFNVLTELTNLIAQENNQTLILDACNRFYTLIPHDFGMKIPLLLNTPELIKGKTEMLNNLLEIEIAYNILKIDKDNSDTHPVDQHFKKLNVNMEVLAHETEEFQRLVKCVAQTHAETHDNYKLVVHDIIKVERRVEQTNKKHKELHNCKLLWHGSRTTNYAGILSQGLRIAPPEAPCTGYMFGKGVYFADMVSKSANYCYTTRNNPTGLLLMCEVALGNMYEVSGAEYITRLEKDKHSTKGLGKTHPNPAEDYVDPNGVVTPMGKGIDSGVKDSSLLYNEFIVYDTSQIRMKYLFKVGFVYEDFNETSD